jgi:hypothetical protein
MAVENHQPCVVVLSAVASPAELEELGPDVGEVDVALGGAGNIRQVPRARGSDFFDGSLGSGERRRCAGAAPRLKLVKFLVHRFRELGAQAHMKLVILLHGCRELRDIFGQGAFKRVELFHNKNILAVSVGLFRGTRNAIAKVHSVVFYHLLVHGIDPGAEKIRVVPVMPVNI